MIGELVTQVASIGLAGSTPVDGIRVAGADAAEFVAELDRQRIVGLGLWATERGELHIEEESLQRLRDRHDMAMAQTMRIELTAKRVSDALTERGIRHRLLKGAALAHSIYGDASLRSFRDVDVLIPSDGIDDAVGVLAGMGASRSSPELRPGFDRRFAKSVTMRLDDVEVDVHRLLAPGPFGVWMRPNDLFVMKDHLDIAGTSIPTLDVTDHLIHACYHVALGQPEPVLANLVDVALLAQRDVDWERVGQTVSRWRGAAALKRCVELVEARLDTELPEQLADYRRATLTADERLAVGPYLSDDPEGRFAALAPATLRALPMSERPAFARAVGFPDGSDPKERVLSMVERFRST